MATDDVRSTTLADFDVDPGVAPEHAPALFARERFVRCTDCGVTVPYSVTARGPIRRALAELATVACGDFELPDVPVGEHVPTVTPERPGHGRSVVCESCGRTAPLGDDGEAVLRALARIPCVEGLCDAELVDMVVSPGAFTPTLREFGMSAWRGLAGRAHGDGVRRVFRHARFQYTTYVRENDDGTFTAAVTEAPDPTADPVATIHFPSDSPADPATRETAVTIVRFLSATDPLSAGEFERLRRAYDDAFDAARTAWVEEAYDRARERFLGQFGDTPEAFAETFANGAEDAEEVMRRTIGSGGFDDVEEAAFAREMLGRDLKFPRFIPFIADHHSWSPPVADAGAVRPRSARGVER